MPRTLALTLIAIGIATPIALLAWLISRAAAAVPEEDRQYKDAPPTGFRIAWWPIQWISHYVEPLIPGKAHHSLAARLRKAGLDYAIRPAQFISARVLCALFVMLLASWGVATLLPARQGALLQALPMAALLGCAACSESAMRPRY